MFVAKWLLFAVLALPLAELLVFIVVAYKVGFAWALVLSIATSIAGAMVLRHAGGSHIERAKVMFGPERVTAVQADAPGLLVLLAGFLLLVPGFITDLAGVVLLIPPLRGWIATIARGAMQGRAPRNPDVVDLAPEDWRHVPDAKLADRRDPRERHERR
jgi:UPF0716 protein FxsA